MIVIHFDSELELLGLGDVIVGSKIEMIKVV